MNKTDKALGLGARERLRTAGQNGGIVNDAHNGFKAYVASQPPQLPKNSVARRYQTKNEREQIKFIASQTTNTEDRNDRYRNNSNNNNREN